MNLLQFNYNFLKRGACGILQQFSFQIPNPSKYRVDLRFFAELVAVGLFRERDGLPLLATQLGYLTNTDKEEHNNLSILTSFCKHCGDDYAGLVPRKYRYSINPLYSDGFSHTISMGMPIVYLNPFTALPQVLLVIKMAYHMPLT